MAIIVNTRMRAIIRIIILFEKVNMDSFLIFSVFAGVVRVISKNKIIHFLFFMFLFSFAVIEDVYINSVIIPEENVRINTKPNQLVAVVLKIIVVDKIEMARIAIASFTGFNVFNILKDRTDSRADVFLLSFDLQNQ